ASPPWKPHAPCPSRRCGGRACPISCLRSAALPPGRPTRLRRRPARLGSLRSLNTPQAASHPHKDAEARDGEKALTIHVHGFPCRPVPCSGMSMKREVTSAVFALVAAASLSATALAAGPDYDRRFFQSVEGQWTGPGEVVAGKYKG